jgi:hypothetical protein
MATRGQIPEPERRLIAGAEGRLSRFILILGALGTLSVWLIWGLKAAAGFLIGVALAWINYWWISQAVSSLLRAGRGRPSKLIYFKFFGRYALIGVVVYVIFSRSLVPILAVVGGLLMLVPAVAAEFLYEVARER